MKCKDCGREAEFLVKTNDNDVIGAYCADCCVQHVSPGVAVELVGGWAGSGRTGETRGGRAGKAMYH